MGSGDGRGRWNLSAYHTVRFTDPVLVAPGGPVLDLLNGEAITTGDKTNAQAALATAVRRIDMAVSKGVYHRKTGSRYISRLSAQVAALA